MDQAFSEVLATNVWKLFPFKSGNRVWVIILVKAYLTMVLFGFCLACILNAVEGNKWVQATQREWGKDGANTLIGETAKGDSALDECFWFVATTMHGIGFGEFYARGNTGRVIAMFCCSIGYLFTIFMMAIIMLSQLPTEKTPGLCSVVSRMVSSLWPSYSVFLSGTLAGGSVVGQFVSRDSEGHNSWATGMYWAWTVAHRSPYGDIFPDTPLGRTLAVVFGMMGVLYIPYALACIAVRCPSSEQHREIVGNLRGNPEGALGRGYAQPHGAAGKSSLEEFVQDAYVREEDDDDTEDGHGCRSCIAVCVLLAFALCAMTFFGGSPEEIEQVVVHSLELDLPPGIHSRADPVPAVVWTFWLHDHALAGDGLATFNNLGTLGVDVEIITTESLPKYNVTESPFHPALKYLSPNHKLDYLHAYFMHHYGGGYLEIKKRKDNSTWLGPFDYIAGNETYWFLGVPSKEDITCDESNIEDTWCKELQFKTEDITFAGTRKGMSSWTHSEGPCCKEVLQYYNQSGLWPRHDVYIMRKETPFTQDWLRLAEEHLSAKMAVLKNHVPPSEPCCVKHEEGYPLRWDELRGEIWSSLLMKYKNHVKFDEKLV